MDANSIFYFIPIVILMLWNADGSTNKNEAFLTTDPSKTRKWMITPELSHKNLSKTLEKRQINSVRGNCVAPNCHCYSRATRRYFCCQCIDDTCFPEDAMVQLENKTQLKMKDLRIGHRILSKDIYNDRMSFSPVIAFLERRTQIYGTYLTLRTNSSKEISLSGIHLMFTSVVTNNNHLEIKYAQDVKLGDHVFVAENASYQSVEEIVGIVREVKKGAYVPLTESGTVFVDGVLASCYASVSSHTIAHAVLSPVRFWPNLFETANSQFDDGLRGYVQVLKVMAKWLLPTNIAFLYLPKED